MRGGFKGSRLLRTSVIWLGVYSRKSLFVNPGKGRWNTEWAELLLIVKSPMPSRRRKGITGEKGNPFSGWLNPEERQGEKINPKMTWNKRIAGVRVGGLKA